MALVSYPVANWRKIEIEKEPKNRILDQVDHKESNRSKELLNEQVSKPFRRYEEVPLRRYEEVPFECQPIRKQKKVFETNLYVYKKLERLLQKYVPYLEGKSGPISPKLFQWEKEMLATLFQWKKEKLAAKAMKVIAMGVGKFTKSQENALIEFSNCQAATLNPNDKLVQLTSVLAKSILITQGVKQLPDDIKVIIEAFKDIKVKNKKWQGVLTKIF